MKKIKAIFTSDTWHSSDSKEMIGVCSKNTIGFIKKYIKENNMEDLQEHDIESLETQKQTQSYMGGMQFIIEDWELDKIGG